jgi:hypothetical protein
MIAGPTTLTRSNGRGMPQLTRVSYTSVHHETKRIELCEPLALPASVTDVDIRIVIDAELEYDVRVLGTVASPQKSRCRQHPGSFLLLVRSRAASCAPGLSSVSIGIRDWARISVRADCPILDPYNPLTHVASLRG